MLIHLTYISIILILLAKIIIPKIAKAIRENDERVSDDWEETDNACCYHISEEYCHKDKWINGDCCRCEECTDKYYKELKK